MSHVIRATVTETTTYTKDFTLAEFLEMGGTAEEFTADTVVQLMNSLIASRDHVGDEIREVITSGPAEYDGDPQYFAEERELSDNPDDFERPRLTQTGGQWYEGR